MNPDSEDCPVNTIAVRLEGGLGDHLLGMRLLRFIHLRYPHHKIVAYSDAGGSVAQFEVAGLSSHVSEVETIQQDTFRVTDQNIGSLANLTSESLMKLRSAEHFFDAHTDLLFLEECYRLNVPHFEVLASRPDLTIPAEALAGARTLLESLPCREYIAINIMKYGPAAVRHHLALIHAFLSEILEDSELGVLHFYVRGYDFPQAPEPSRTYRRQTCTLEAAELDSLEKCYPGRVFSMVDQPIPSMAALLKKCLYFVGVDNGVKHLAWALNVPRTWLSPGRLGKEFILRWVPDYHCMLEIPPFCDMEVMGRLLASRVRHVLNQNAGNSIEGTRDNADTVVS
jgi:glycosyl transferase family 9 (putative heptosyltransferase)